MLIRLFFLCRLFSKRTHQPSNNASTATDHFACLCRTSHKKRQHDDDNDNVMMIVIQDTSRNQIEYQIKNGYKSGSII